MADDDLTSLAAVKGWLGLDPAQAGSDDEVLTGLIASASAFIRGWCARQFTVGTVTEVRDGSGGTRMAFRETPVQSVASLTIDGRDIPPAVAWGRNGYRFTPTSLTMTGYRFTRGVGNVRLVYDAGYSGMPADLTQACTELVGQRFRDKDRIGLIAKGRAGETTQFAQADLPLSVRAALEGYRRVVPA